MSVNLDSVPCIGLRRASDRHERSPDRLGGHAVADPAITLIEIVFGALPSLNLRPCQCHIPTQPIKSEIATGGIEIIGQFAQQQSRAAHVCFGRVAPRRGPSFE
jgi:hypothetical protein